MDKQKALQIVKDSMQIALQSGKIKLEETQIMIAAYNFFATIEIKEDEQS